MVLCVVCACRRSYQENLGIKKIMVVLTSVCGTGKLGSSMKREDVVILCVVSCKVSKQIALGITRYG